ncbi:hypothetical protein [Mesobacillus harenae]|uniref:hypothetical protein n=1 Tax=Mesobacillus harenae TaxID=2213203 RepID=UPI00157FF610|nr:hypothetical protein [Mesobacillus harenae]
MGKSSNRNFTYKINKNGKVYTNEKNSLAEEELKAVLDQVKNQVVKALDNIKKKQDEKK